MGRIAGVTADETRQRLLQAAAQVFETKGYEGATVALIAQEAGVSTGAIYGHYSGKAELMVEALRLHRERVTATLLPPGQHLDVAAVLVDLAGRLGGPPQVGSALLCEALLSSRRDPELARVLTEALTEREGALASLIVQGQDRGELSGNVTAESAARFALMLLLGALFAGQLELAPVDPAEWSTLVERMVAPARSAAPT